jgi:hypothetical protein
MDGEYRFFKSPVLVMGTKEKHSDIEKALAHKDTEKLSDGRKTKKETGLEKKRRTGKSTCE